METILPDSDEIQPERARFLYEEHCAILVIENLPIGSEFGIDLSSYRIGDKFKGVKLIPPGIHFVFMSAVDKNTTDRLGPRTGFYHNFRTKELIVKRWSIEDEDIDDSYVPDEEHILRLTSRITPELIADLMPDCGKIRSVPYLVRRSDETSSGEQTLQAKRTIIRHKSQEEELLPDLKPASETVIKFTKLPSDYDAIKDNNMTQEMITQYHLDSTKKLESAYQGPAGKQRLLGEIQFAFITLILSHVYECFEKWQQLLTLICKADSAILDDPAFFADFTQIIHHQLEQVPEELFVDISDANNLIYARLSHFFDNVQHQHASVNGVDIPDFEELVTHVRELQEFLRAKFNWQFDLDPEDHDPEDQPVIVHLES